MIKSVQYEHQIKWCLKGCAEDRRISLDSLGGVAAGLGIDGEMSWVRPATRYFLVFRSVPDLEKKREPFVGTHL